MKGIKKPRSRVLLLCLFCLLPIPVFAHPGGAADHGLGAGLWHPLSGLDHLLAAVVVGLWASQVAARRLWLLPSVFTAALIAGAVLAGTGTALPYTEQVIAASLLVLGLGVAAVIESSPAVSATLAAVFALFHGYAHGTEMSVSGSAAYYLLGLTLSTVLLQATGVAAGRVLQRLNAVPVIRLAGGAIALAGAYFAG